MAYGLLLYKEIEAPEGLHRLEVWKDGYAGDAIEIDGLVRDSIHISKNAGDACDAITTSVLTFALYDTGQLDYSQFFTPNAVLFKVVWKMNGSARWTGYLTPDSYSENLSYRDTITLTARDNLGRLNDYDFNLARGQMMTVRSLIVQGLTVAGVAMDTVFVTTKVASSPETTLAIDGLVNTSLLVGGSWHEALTLLLEGLGLTLSWNDGNKFEVRDITQAPSASQSAFFISKSGYRQIRPAWKNLTAVQDYGLLDNFYEGQFSKEDCGTGTTFTPASEGHWSVAGSFVMMNPYVCGAAEPAESLFIPLVGGDTITDALTYTFHAPALDRAIKMVLKCNNSAWQRGLARGGAWAVPKIVVGQSHGVNVTRYYWLRYRFNIFATINGVRYVLRETWEVYDPTTIVEPYLYFVMPGSEGNTDADNEVTFYLAEIPGAADIELVIYPAVAQLAEDAAPAEVVGPGNYGLIKDVTFTVMDAVAGVTDRVTVNTAHNIQSSLQVALGQVPRGRGNVLLYLGGLFYSDDDYTSLTDFARAEEGTEYPLLELVSREHIAFNNDNYDILSGTMRAAAAFRFDRAIAFEGGNYRIIAASLAVLSNTLSVSAMQTEPEFPTADYIIEEVDSEGGYSRRGSYGGSGVPQGGSSDASQENILVLTEGLAKAYARLTSLEDWLRDPAFDELPLDTLNVARCINLGGMAMEYDAENGAWHLLGNFYADGWVSAGGVNSEGGGGGGGIDLGAMWTSLRNTPTQTSEVTADTKIALAHLPYTAGAGVSISNAGAISIAESGIEPGTYTKVTVDAYGRVTNAENPTTLAGYGITDALGVEELLPLTEGIATVVARVSSLEDWLRDPAFDEVAMSVANVARCVNIGGIIAEYDAENEAWHLMGNFYADGWVSAGGLNSSGGGGAGGIDLGAMWTSLCNTPVATSDVTSTTKIAVAHLPYTSGTGINITGSEIALSVTAVAPGTYNLVTVDAYGRVTAGSMAGAEDLEAVVSEGLAQAFARIGSLEDWLRNPWLDELSATALNAQTVDVGTLLTVDGAANIAGLLTASGELKVTGSSKKIWLGDNVYIELDTNGYIHTNGAFYSDSFISAGGLGTGGGGGGGLDLGAMWTSLCNTTVHTSSVNANTKIAVAHIPDITTSKISDLSTWWTTQRATLNLGAAASKGIGTVADGNTDLVTGDSVYDFTTAAIATAIGNINTFALKTTTISAGTGLTGGGNLSANRTIALSSASIASLAKADTAVQPADLAQYINSLVVSGEGDFVASLSKSGKVLTATMGSLPDTDAIELSLSEGYASVSARVQSLEDWLRDPALDTLAVDDLCAATATVTRIYIGDAYFEYDADGYLHTNAPLYSDEWISAGGVEAGGGGSVDLGAVWTSLCNEPIATADITPTTKIALSHIPISAGAGISISNAGAVSLALSGVAAGTYAAVTVDAYGRVTSGSAPAALTFGSKTYDGTVAQTLTAADIGAITEHQDIYSLYINDAGGTTQVAFNAAQANKTLTLTKAMVGLGNVENVALSTWYGSTYIRTVGTITYGAWHGSPISNAYLENSTITLAGTAVSLGGGLTAAQLRSLLSINRVENTALSTWGGSTYINTVGTITTGTWQGSRIANSYLQNSAITLAGRTISLGGTVTKNEMLYDLGLTSATSDIATLASYFTNGVAKEAARLTAVSKTAWGQTYWTSDGVPTNISGTMNGVTAIDDTMYFTAGSGKVGIGVISPSETLDVGGTFRVSGNAYLGSLVVIGGGSAYLEAAGSYLHTNVGFAADGFISAGGVASSSDARLKKNLKDIALTVHDIAAAPAVSFDWVDDRGSSAGSIAQYWQPLLPENVRAWEVDGMLSMEYGNIALLAAITIARAVETQDQKIAQLEARVQELENQLLKH